jgi:hypothetical protein
MLSVLVLHLCFLIKIKESKIKGKKESPLAPRGAVAAARRRHKLVVKHFTIVLS